MTLATDIDKLKRLRELRSAEPAGVQRDERLARIDKEMSDRQMQFLRMQSAHMDTSQMSPIQQFGTSAGLQANRMYEGAKDLLGFGDEQQRQSEMTQQGLVDQALGQQSPVTNFSGNMLGATVAALPLSAAAEGAVPFGMGLLGRTLLSGGVGAAEGAIALPDQSQNESRFSNSIEGAGYGLLSEPVATGLATGIKRAYQRLKNTGVLASAPMKEQVQEALVESGVDITSLKPETQEMLSKLSSTDNVETAINQAVETEFGFKLTAGQQSGDFNTLREEQFALRNNDEFRDFAAQQSDDIFTATEDLAASQGGTNISLQGGTEARDQTGAKVKGALEDTRASDEREYGELYGAAEQLSKELQIELPVNVAPVQKELEGMMRDHGNTHTALLRSIEDKLASYGAARPGVETSNPFNLPDVDTRQLSMTNNEDLIKDLNSLYDPNDPVAARIVARVKDSIVKSSDESMDLMDAQLGDTMGDLTKKTRKALEVARAARASRRSYSQLWENKDVLHDLTDTKTKSTADKVQPSAVAQRVMRSPEDAARVVNLLEDRQASGALSELRTFVLKDLFSLPGVLTKGRTTDQMISGDVLMKKINAKASTYRAILGDDQFNKLQGLAEQISKATSVPRAAENTSNTAYETFNRVARLFADVTQPGAGVAVGMIDAKGMANASKVSQATRGALDTNQQPDIFEALKLNDSNHTAFNLIMRQYLGADEVEESEGALSE